MKVISTLAVEDAALQCEKAKAIAVALKHYLEDEAIPPKERCETVYELADELMKKLKKLSKDLYNL